MYAAAMPRRPETEYELHARTALRAAMYYRGMTDAAVARAIGVAANTVGRWARGERRMSAEEAAALTAALDAPSDLFARPPESRERALAMMAAWDELRAGGARSGPSQP